MPEKDKSRTREAFPANPGRGPLQVFYARRQELRKTTFAKPAPAFVRRLRTKSRNT